MNIFQIVVIFFLALQACQCCFGVGETNVTALGAWSEPITNKYGHALRGRLLISEHLDDDGSTTHHLNVGVYIDLQRMPDSTDGELQVYCDFTEELKCQVSDVFGRPPEPVGTGYNGGVPSPQWISLSPLASVRLRASVSGGGRLRDGSFGIWFANAGDWTIERSDTNTYFLSGILAITSPTNIFDETRVWSGTLELPKMKLPTSQPVIASPTSDLASPSQEVRDAAAKILRETYVPPPQTNWDSLVAKLKLGTPKTNVLEILGHFTNNIAGGGGSGATETERYRLDDLWLLDCSYTGDGANRVLTHLGFMQELRFVTVDLPAGFTGNWRTYYVNGQIFGEGWYKNGKAEGEGFGCYPDGSKLVVNHVTNGVLEGEEIGYFQSGKIKYKGSYKTNSQVGTWIWYNEDGTVQLKRDYPQP